MSKPIRRLGFYSRKSALEAVDRRSSEAKFMRTIIARLENDLGGPDKISFRQAMLLPGAADIALRLELAKGRYVRAADDDRQIDLHVCTLQGTLIKTLKALDFDPVKDIGPTLAEYLSAKPAVRVDDAA